MSSIKQDSEVHEKYEIKTHPHIVTLVLGELGGHSQPGDSQGGSVGGEVGSHRRGDSGEGGPEEENGEQREKHCDEQTPGN